MAGRYASALFELALDARSLDKVSTDLDGFNTMLDQSADLRRLVMSPAFTAGQQTRAVKAVMDRAGISGLAANFVALVARNRRLFAIRDMIEGFRRLVAAHRGEMTAEVTSARPLSPAQTKALKAALKDSTGKDVQISAKVDETLLGGLIVKVGSRQVDSSLRTKLNNLRVAMKEVG